MRLVQVYYIVRAFNFFCISKKDLFFWIEVFWKLTHNGNFLQYLVHHFIEKYILGELLEHPPGCETILMGSKCK